jgi:hypothetical protein
MFLGSPGIYAWGRDSPQYVFSPVHGTSVSSALAIGRAINDEGIEVALAGNLARAKAGEQAR